VLSKLDHLQDMIFSVQKNDNFPVFPQTNGSFLDLETKIAKK